MVKLLFVSHSPSPNTIVLETAAVAAISGLGQDAPLLRIRAPRDAAAPDLDWCDGVLIGTTENFGYMAGLTKDFFERIYYPCLESTRGLPYALYIRAGEDGRGTRESIGRITTGLRWKPIAEPLILRGRYDAAFEGRVSELAETLAAGLEAGIF